MGACTCAHARDRACTCVHAVRSRAFTLRPRLRGVPPSDVSGPQLAWRLVLLSYATLGSLLVDMALCVCVIAVAHIYDTGSFCWLLLPLLGHMGVLGALCLRYRFPHFYAHLRNGKRGGEGEGEGEGAGAGAFLEAGEEDDHGSAVVALPGAVSPDSEKLAKIASVVLVVSHGIAIVGCIAVLADDLGHPLAFTPSRSTAIGFNVVCRIMHRSSVSPCSIVNTYYAVAARAATATVGFSDWDW